MENRSLIRCLRTMSQELEQRVAELERKVAELSTSENGSGRHKDWRRTIGIFANDPVFDEVVRRNREYREQQTYEKEVANT